jgi:glycosyltransferase involved in cell wall biosynthesis
VVPRIAAGATSIVTDSDYSRQEILQYLSVNPSQVHTVYIAPGPAFRRLPDPAEAAAICARLGLSGPFIVGLGAVDPRKNTLRLLEAFAAARPDLPAGCQLALVGLPAGVQTGLSAAVDRLDLAGAVRLLGFVSEAELVALYNQATVMAYPSLYEGFGLPVLEAMACGAPVISSNVTSIPEVAGDAALLIDPRDPQALAQALIQVATDPARQAELRRRGLAQAGQFSWAATACAMLALYEAAGRA